MLFVMSLTIVVKVDLMSNQDRSMSIGAVAAQAGRRPSSIRYYEQIGLLPRPDRVSGRRVYGPDTVRTLAVIETGQRAGLTLDEIKDLLSASDGDQGAKLVLGLGPEDQAQAVRGLGPLGQRPRHQPLPAPGLGSEVGHAERARNVDAIRHEVHNRC